MQKLRITLLNAVVYIMVSIVLLFLIGGNAQAKKAELGQILGSDINMRAASSVDAKALKALPMGSEVEILAQDDGWYRIVYEGITGYVREDLIFVRSVAGRIAYALKDDVNLRGGPGTSAYVIKKLVAGKPMRVKIVSGEWYYVDYEGVLGFVHKDLVSLTQKETGGYAQLLRYGMEGSEIKRMQQELVRRNFLDEKHITGTYGARTRNAVSEFQSVAKLGTIDGTAGPETITLLYDKSNHYKKAPKIPKSKSDFYDNVQLIDWWNGGKNVLKRPGGTAVVYDVLTGKSFKIRRTGGNKHNDVVPYTASDTSIMKSVYGGRWSWSRRAILVIVGSKAYAASMNGMPHPPDVQKNDDFPGLFCIHFKNSRTHGGDNVDSQHQSMINYAYRKFAKS